MGVARIHFGSIPAASTFPVCAMRVPRANKRRQILCPRWGFRRKIQARCRKPIPGFSVREKKRFTLWCSCRYPPELADPVFHSLVSRVTRSADCRTGVSRGLASSGRGKRGTRVDGVSRVFGSPGGQTSGASIRTETCCHLGHFTPRRTVVHPTGSASFRPLVNQRAAIADDLLVVGITPATLLPESVITR